MDLFIDNKSGQPMAQIYNRITIVTIQGGTAAG